MKIEYKNYTPHTIKLNDGTEYPSLGKARVSASFAETETDGEFKTVYGEIEGLPAPEEGVKIIVSMMVLAANGGKRSDLVAPATGHPQTVRDEKGFIVSVPGFVIN